MKIYVITISVAFLSTLATTISTTFVQALDRQIPDFGLNVFRVLGPAAMVLPFIIKVHNTVLLIEFKIW